MQSTRFWRFFLRTSPGRKRAASAVGLRGRPNEVGPRRARVGRREGPVRPAKQRQRGFVRGALRWLQFDLDRNDVVRRQETSSQIRYTEPIDDRADQHLQSLSHVTRAGGRSEPQPSWRRAHLQGFVTYPVPEVVGLLDDEQPESMSDSLHRAECALKRRDGDGLHRTQAIAEGADRATAGRAQRGSPLVQEHPGRHETQRRKLRSSDRSNGYVRLPAAGRKHHDTALSGRLPQLQRRFLVVA